MTLQSPNIDPSASRTFKHAETLFDPKSKNIQLHRMCARNSNFNSQVTLYDMRRFLRHHTRLIWTRLLRGHSNTRRDFDPKSENTQLHRMCARNSNFNSQVTFYDSPRFLRHHTRLIWTRLLGGHSNTRIHFLTPKSKNIQLHRMCARNSNFNGQVTLYDGPRFLRHHTHLI